VPANRPDLPTRAVRARNATLAALAAIAAALAGFHEGPNLLQLLSTAAAGGFAFWMSYLGSLGSKKAIQVYRSFRQLL
jgi:hypothetical protein